MHADWSLAHTGMARIFFGVSLVAVLIVQASLAHRFWPFPVVPDVSVILMYFWVMRRSLRESLAWMFLGGIFADVLALDTLGVHALAFIPVLALAYPLRTQPWRVNVISVSVLLGFAALFQSFLLAILRGTMPTMDNLLQAAMVAILGPLAFIMFRILVKR